ncbi:MAG: succinylglutamate desuccinylase/aspartoacylase family protein [Oligoflexales bacterium]|nr:succinylglutamate desuccinylase/aspartoacylase family protein [Oligoflexales bacterium]
MQIEFQEITTIPESLLSISASELHSILPKPTILHLDGKKKPPLLISCLLHGNEHSGFLMVQNILKNFLRDNTLARETYFLFGNVDAAAKNQRKLDHQPDFNRIWRDERHPLVKRVLELVKEKNFMAAIDLHNNTGRNPHYACVSQAKAEHINLALLFSPHLVYFTAPDSTLSVVLSKTIPALTLECGLSLDPEICEKGQNFLNALYRLDNLPKTLPCQNTCRLQQSTVNIKVPSLARVGYGNLSAHNELQSLSKDFDIILRSDLDTLNFTEIKKSEVLAFVENPEFDLVLNYLEPAHALIHKKRSYMYKKDSYFYIEPGLTPSMLTLNAKIMKEDCLGYLMIPIEIKNEAST